MPAYGETLGEQRKIEECARLRGEISIILEDLEKIATPGNAAGRELALVRTKLQEARMWLGMAKGAFGAELPDVYKDAPKRSV